MRTPQDHLDFMSDPDRWPNWTLALKRYQEVGFGMDFGTLAETEVTGVFRFTPETGGVFQAQVGGTSLLQSLIDSGWRVD